MRTVSETAAAAGASLKSLVKIALQSRRATVRRAGDDTSRPIVILGNGPSLNQTIAESLPLLRQTACMAVNFAANAPQFTQIRPRYYILVDPHFFSGKADPNLERLWQNLRAVSWRMTLIVPCPSRRQAQETLQGNTMVDIATVNTVGVEGWRWLTDATYRSGRGMPRPRNVLIPAIMAAVQMGYREIYITGADHSWMQTISVDDDNRVVSVQPHFYKEDDREVKRINTEYMHYPLHRIIHSFYVAFKSYHDIQAFATRRGIAVYNATPGSYIDAFPRRPLPHPAADGSDPAPSR